MLLAAFKCRMTEIELSWGDRPDGTVYSNCKQALQERIKQLESSDSKHYRYRGGPITLVEVTQELFDKIEKTGIYSTLRNDDPGEIK
jgi:hypothetical protein